MLTTQGVELDRCASCEGVWLDRGELLLFAKRPEAVSRRLSEAVAKARPGHKRSPATGGAMAQIDYPGGGQISYPLWHCPEIGGLWLDAGQLRALLKGEPGIAIDVDPATAADRRDAAAAAVRRAPAAAGLLALPNLALRSTAVLVGLYALLGAALIAAVELLGLDPTVALLGGIAAVLLQFAIGPFLMDLSLRWLYRMDWVAPEQLPEHLRRFVERVCHENRMRFPRFGIIDDGAPQAFTYGYSPNSARIVISRGIIELLEPDEAEAVVAHEIGHAVHWDMVLMTVVQLVPLVLYYLYRMLIRMRSRGRDKGAGARIAIAIAAYLLYLVSQYVVLWFSRTREYHADRFAGAATGRPSALASALVKIAYGLAAEGRSSDAGGDSAAQRRDGLAAVGAMGIFDRGAATALALTSYSAADRSAGGVDQTSLRGAMRWDLWNPWARWYELHSTHPLVANRLRYLSDQALQLGQPPFVTFDEVQPESYWDEFLADLAILLLPSVAALCLALVSLGTVLEPAMSALGLQLSGVMLAALGGTLLLRYGFVYRADFFADLSIAALLKKVKVSAVRPVPCRLKGTIIGRGVPGYIFSEDFVLRDDSGIIFLDYRQPLAIWDWLFGLLRAGRYEGREVVVEGWYRRAPVPYVQLKSIELDGKASRSWVPLVSWLFAWVLTAGGIGWAAAVALGVI